MAYRRRSVFEGRGHCIGRFWGSGYGYYGDAAITVPVGEKIDPKTARLLAATERSLHAALQR